MIKDNDIATKTFVQITVDTAINRSRDELIEEIKQSRNENLTYFDKLLGLFHKLDEEKTLGAYRQSEHTDQLENHEQRITTLETATASS